MIVFKSEGDPAAVLAYDDFLEAKQQALGWLEKSSVMEAGAEARRI